MILWFEKTLGVTVVNLANKVRTLFTRPSLNQSSRKEVNRGQ